jgi:hypothetical protein
MQILNSQLLKEMIRNALTEVEAQGQQEPAPGVDTKFKTGVMSTSQRMKQSRERIKAAGEELEPNEQKLIDQLEAKLTQLAALPGVDMTKHRPTLIRVLKLLVSTMTPKENK